MEKNNFDYDVVIVGGGTAGCACAWNCAKLGLKTLLIEKKSYLGGAIASQLVIPAMKTEHKNLNMDFYIELCRLAHEKNAQITYSDGNIGWLNPLKISDVLSEMLLKVGCEIKYNTIISNNCTICIDKKHNDKNDEPLKILSLCIDTKHNDNKKRLKCFEMKDNNNIDCSKNTLKNILEKLNHDTLQKISAKYFIDASGDGHLCELAGAEFLQHEHTQAMSLRFIMNNVDKKAFADWILDLDKDRNVTTVADIDNKIHLSTACTWDLSPNWALKPLFDKAVQDGTLKDSDRAYFQVFSIAGEEDKIAFNCPRIMSDLELNPLSNDDKNEAKRLGIESIGRLARFCNLYLKGFENATVYKIADEIGIRESRRVKGKYVLKKEDIFSAKKFDNPIAFSNYPIDVHSIKKDESVLNYVQKVYAVPLESLIVEGFLNLYVIGRCISTDFYAQAAVRIQPTCFAMGEGLAKHLRL